MLTQVPNRMMEPGSFVPPGAVMSFAMSAAPVGWLPCDGAAINRTTYAPLFSAIGYTYGGSGNSFNIPDLRGEFVRGWSSGRSVDTGRVFGSSQNDEFKAHKHDPIDPGGTWGGRPRAVSGNSSGSDGDLDGSVRITGYDKASVDLNLTTEGGNETRPRNIALLYCIKF